MQLDPRDTDLYRVVQDWYRKALGPSFGSISDATDLDLSPDDRKLAFTGVVQDGLDVPAVTRICLLDLASGAVEQLTDGPNSDHSPRWSPRGDCLAFLSDRRESGIDQPYLLEADLTGEPRLLAAVDGAVEYLAWSPDGSSLLLSVAPRGADLAGAAGSGRIPAGDDAPSWLPTTETGSEDRLWRTVLVVDTASGSVRRQAPKRLNVWEAAWCGWDKVAVVASDEPGEDGWYGACLALLDVRTGTIRTLYGDPRYGAVAQQLAFPTPSPSGDRIAIVQAICSDRGSVSGDVRVVNVGTGTVTAIDTLGVDASRLAWPNEQRLILAGKRGLENAIVESSPLASVELWSGPDSIGGSGSFPVGVSATDSMIYCLRESYTDPPEIVRLQDGKLTALHAFSDKGTAFVASGGGRMRPITWRSTDGLEIEGLLILPGSAGPHPLVVAIHGGPVGASVSSWAMRMRGLQVLIQHGYAMLLPNPRGSAGRGQAFVASLIGDMGGRDAEDITSAVDELVAAEIADPNRIGVIGTSYGGFMSAWLITQSQRFAAAVVVAPITDWPSFHDTTNISRFDDIFRAEPTDAQAGHRRSEQRSPVLHADRVRTPALLIAGGMDLCTPPSQAVQFHRALVRRGQAQSMLVTYPTMGHGPRTFPHMTDFTARVLGWFAEHMPT